MRQKVLMLLGGSRYLLPVIEQAHELGIYVVTCDYLPENIAHRYSDQYVNVSIVDEEAVLAAAVSIGADGIMSYAADPGVLSAAYAAEQLGLPFQTSYEATRILQDKELFRAYLRDHGFNAPWSTLVTRSEEATQLARTIDFPVIVKPTDSAGSKGVTRVDGAEALESAVTYALEHSLSGRCIIEEFIEKRGQTSGADSFTVDGHFSCFSFTAQRFDESANTPFVPVGHALPDSFTEDTRASFESELQRIAGLLGFRSGIYNIEVRERSDGTPFLMEVSPRAGGNRLAELLRAASGVDLIRASIEAALGVHPSGVRQPEYDGFWYLDVLFSRTSGVFRGIEVDPQFRGQHLKDEAVWIESGDRVEAFLSANHAFGSLFLRFDSRGQLEEYLANKERFVSVLVDA